MNEMNIEDATRKQVAEFLPRALYKALGSYTDFIETEKDIDDSKKYAEYQKAGKVAIAHIHLLIKLAEWVQIEQSEKLQPDLKTILSAAQQEVNHYDCLHFVAGTEEKDLA